MRSPTLLIVTLAAITALACDSTTETPPPDNRNESSLSSAGESVPIASTTATEQLQLPGESVTDAKQRRIRQILSLHPDLGQDQAIVDYLQGRLDGANLVAIGKRYADVASLIAEVNELNYLENRQAAQERQGDRIFRNTDSGR